MKEVDYEITKEGGSIQVGKCMITFLPWSVTNSQKVKFLLLVEETKPPDGLVRACATLISQPPIKLKKSARIQMTTWFIAKNIIDASVYKLANSQWNEIDSVALTNENFIDIQVKELSNVTVFMSKKFLHDVEIRIKSYLFHNSSGSFKTAFGPSDEIMESNLTNEMSKGHHTAVVSVMRDMTVSIGDEICYKFDGTEKAESTSGPQLRGKVMIDESFITEFKGQISTYDLKAVPIVSSYNLQHRRVEAEGNVLIGQENYPVVLQQNTGSTAPASIEFLGKFEADNFLSSVEDVRIDQRTTIEGTKKTAALQRRDDLIYEQPDHQTVLTANSQAATPATGLIVETGPHLPARTSPGVVIQTEGRGQPSRIKFLGDVKVKNMIGNAKNVTIDQRRTYKTPGSNASLPVKTAVQAENDLPFPVQTAAEVPPLPNGMTLDEKNEIESMATSGRAFMSPTETEDQPSNRR